MREGSFAADQKSVPSPYGAMTFEMQIRPVSMQASRSTKDSVTNAVRSHTEPLKYILTGDVAVEIVWSIREESRYESDGSADVDNVVKPILDALCGPSGVLINDCQVQYASSHWVDTDADDSFTVTIKYDPEAWYPKESLGFVQFAKALCMPLNLSLPPKGQLLMLNAFERQLKTRETLLEFGQSYRDARMVMSIQRPFHRTRVSGFRVFPLDELRQKMAEQRGA